MLFPNQDQTPFAVVGSTDEIVVGGHKVRARQYPWGTVEGQSHRHRVQHSFGIVLHVFTLIH